MRSLTFYVLGREVRVPKGVVDEFITTVLTNQPYWQSGWLDKEDVDRFLRGDVDLKLLDRVGMYILMWCENIMFSSYLNLLAMRREHAEGYRENALRSLGKLRKMYSKIRRCRELERKYELVRKLMYEAIDLGLDPF